MIGSGGVTSTTATGGAGFATAGAGGAGGITGTTTTGGTGFFTIGGGGTIGESFGACTGASVFKSAGRGFGKGGTSAGSTGATGVIFDGTSGCGVVELAFALRLCAAMALDVLHFVDGKFAQSCRLMRFKLFSTFCSRDAA